MCGLAFGHRLYAFAASAQTKRLKMLVRGGKMRYKWDKKYLYWGITAFCVIAAATIFNLAVSNYQVFIDVISKIVGALMPVFYGFVIAYLLCPIANFFEKKLFMRIVARKSHGDIISDNGTIKKKKVCRAVSVLIAMLIFFLAIAGIIIIVLPQLIDTVTKIVNNMQGYIDTTTNWANSAFAQWPEVQDAVTDVITNFSKYVMDFLKDWALPQMNDIMATVSNGIMTIISVFLNVFFGIVIAVYFLYNRELFGAQVKKVLYGFIKPKYSNTIIRNFREIHRTFGGFLSGKLIESFLLMMLYFIVLTVFNFPYAMLCSVIMGIFNIIPVFGAFIGAVPCALLILLDDPIYCLYFVIVVCVAQQIDGNIIGPKVLGESTGLSSFWVIFALLVGQGLIGIWGLIIGIPIFAVVYSIFRSRVGRKLEKKGLPSDSNVYRKVAYVDERSGELITLYELSEQQRKEKRERESKEQAQKEMKDKTFWIKKEKNQ